jgi:hypothetical protein
MLESRAGLHKEPVGCPRRFSVSSTAADARQPLARVYRALHERMRPEEPEVENVVLEEKEDVCFRDSWMLGPELRLSRLTIK